MTYDDSLFLDNSGEMQTPLPHVRAMVLDRYEEYHYEHVPPPITTDDPVRAASPGSGSAVCYRRRLAADKAQTSRPTQDVLRPLSNGRGACAAATTRFELSL